MAGNSSLGRLSFEPQNEFGLQLKGELIIKTSGQGTRMPGTVVRELSMRKDTMKRREWIKPKLTRLGEIRDVAGNQTPGPQGSGAKT